VRINSDGWDHCLVRPVFPEEIANAELSMILRAFLTLILALASPSVLACSACFGQSDSPLATGMNYGILVLLLVVTGVLGAFAVFFAYLARRSARYPAPGPESTEPLTENPTKAW
jgi:hypothetical protein